MDILSLENPSFRKALINVVKTINEHRDVEHFNTYALERYAEPFGEGIFKWLNSQDLACWTKGCLSVDHRLMESLLSALEELDRRLESKPSLISQAIQKMGRVNTVFELLDHLGKYLPS